LKAKWLIGLVIMTMMAILSNGCASGDESDEDSNNGGGQSTANSAPVANAGTDQNVSTGSTVTLDGSGSSDADPGDTLTYSWSFISVPGGSLATLSDSAIVNPTFTADIDGTYVIQLVVNDGTVNSAADTVSVTAATANSTPVSNAGTDQNVSTGSTVTLDGSGSSDANAGDTLTYSWSIISTPTGSLATLSDSAIVNPTFTADIDGTYVIQLVVNDGTINSAADTVVVTAATANSAPVANAGTDQNVSTGSTVTLDGSSSSDADSGDTLTYSWSISSTPSGSSATLSDSTVVNPTFTADLDGTYVIQLVVNDGTINSAADTVVVTAAVYFTMISVPGGLTFPTGTSDDGTADVTDAYEIGETEVTYEQWHTVYTWATSNGYSFANEGREGNDGTDGAVPTVADQEPVTVVNWRDSMVWMNALTEYNNAQRGTNYTAVYTYNSSIVRDSRDSNDTTCDNVVAGGTADGFRLLTSNEWELAARYIDDGNSDGDILDADEYYPGDYASGATADYTDATATGSVAVYFVNSGSATAEVKSRTSNALGIYDMSGNVVEWLFDTSGSGREFRGGGWGSGANLMRVGSVVGYSPYNELGDIGFRFARTP
jgi:formylglycine-generating enzyme required for sulfatase activity